MQLSLAGPTSQRLPSSQVVLAGFLALAATGGPSSLLRAREGPSPEPATGSTAPAESWSFEGQVRPFLASYCTECHGERRKRAGLALDVFDDATAVLKKRDVWERVRDMLLQHEMPPERRDQPSASDRQSMVDWIQAELDRFDCTGSIDPGHVTIRRLNRAEYDNTIRDLTGVDFRPAGDFPIDEVGYGFDNIGDVLALPPLLMEKYLDAAEEVVDRLLDRQAEFYFHRRFEAENEHVTASSHPFEHWALSIDREGEVRARCELPEDGEYVLRTRAWAQQAGPELARLALRVDGREIATFEVSATVDGPSVHEARAELASGSRLLSVAYLNNYVNNNHPDPGLRGDRNLLVDWFEVEIVRSPEFEAGHRRLFTARPAQPRDREACARRVLESLAGRAFRRPVGPRELDRLLALALDSMGDGDSFETGIAVALKAVLVSPRFLFRVEEPPAEAGVVVPVSDHELASRLSYFLWSSMPDDELLGLAAAGRLQDDAVLEAQTRRLLADPRSRSLVENFGGQWLQTRFLETASPDPEIFPDFDDDLRRDMETETLLFFESILREDRSVLELLDSDYTFVNERLARHYGIPDVDGEEFRRVRLKDGVRGGVLTQGSVLTITSNPRRTSPVKRGKWILEQILGAPPPPPPPDVPELEEDREAITSGSLRQRLERHRDDPNCSVCHEKMDPLGFALENFDAVGAWREFDGMFLVDSSGALPDGREFEGPRSLKKILLAERDDFARNLAEKMLTYAIGRGLEYYDVCAVEKVLESLRTHDYRMSGLVLGVVRSDPFRKKRGGVEE